ncbi:hypothetical protein ACFX10_029417 [Malus domestica]
MVVGKKEKGKWRVCVDYTNLNRACRKDCFPIPKIDQTVDATAGYALLSFLDAYYGYNQILMAVEDQEKNAFIIERGLYCYTIMPFGLKNVGSTYQRLVNKMFKNQIGNTMEVYINDMVIKSRERCQHIDHLRNTFDVLRRYHMRLNPVKCAFGVSSGQFLGHIVNKQGIEPNPAKIEALCKMPDPVTPRDIQVLTGRIVALSRFISRSSDRCKPFFQAIRNRKGDVWGQEQNEACEQLKKYLISLLLLTIPKQEELLYMYLAVSEGAVSAALFREEGLVQQPIFYVSKSLIDAEKRYSPTETAKKKLR